MMKVMPLATISVDATYIIRGTIERSLVLLAIVYLISKYGIVNQKCWLLACC